MQDLKCKKHNLELRYVCTSTEFSNNLLKPFCLKCFDEYMILQEMIFPNQFVENLKKSFICEKTNFQKRIKNLELEEINIKNSI